MSEELLVSHAQNAEDVVLWRALGSVQNGRYVEVGANHPAVDSISKAFYDRGWAGVAVEPVPAFAQAYREARPRDVVVEAAVTDAAEQEVVLHVFEGTGLSTVREDISAGHEASGIEATEVRVPARRLDDVLVEHVPAGEEIHFLMVDVEGAEHDVLRSIDLSVHRPWVLVVEATAPRSRDRTHHEWEHIVLGNGYVHAMFDGLSQWYVAQEHVDLLPELDHPACPLDSWVPIRTFVAERRVESLDAELGGVRLENAELTRQVVSWRGRVLEQWAKAARTATSARGSSDNGHLRQELDALQRTLSWRITAPLRSVRSAQLRRSRRP
ncbi:FkbM family methyltransferase [Klenkia marina]|uniref:FkbM family methyltransferase n=1 Tax=Klenkia marina TaxID=1960309 RepID=UPI001403D16F|nr:FkbM family methyltransferase [Klenkia marina]